MSNVTTATATTDNGPVQIEIQIPDANRAAEWNAAIAGGAEKAGVEIPGVTPKPAADTTKKEEPILHRAVFTVNGKEMVFEDADPVSLLKQYTAAVQASQLAPAPAATTQQTTEKEKPGLSAADMFDVGTKLISGDASGLDTLLEKSGAMDRWFEKQGLSVEQIKAATQKTQSDTVMDALTTAKNQFVEKVKAGEIDFPGGQQNEKMGMMLARVQAEDQAAGKDGKFTLDSFVRAYDLMKKEGLVFPVEKKPATEQTTQQTTTTTKTAPSSTVVGANGAGKETPQTGIDPKSKFEIDMTTLSPEEAARTHRELLRQGVKPEQIVVKT